jgi:hypothetical protein
MTRSSMPTTIGGWRSARASGEEAGTIIGVGFAAMRLRGHRRAVAIPREQTARASFRNQGMTALTPAVNTLSPDARDDGYLLCMNKKIVLARSREAARDTLAPLGVR